MPRQGRRESGVGDGAAVREQRTDSIASARNTKPRQPAAIVLDIDDYDLCEARGIVARFGTERFGYVATANVDHVIRHFFDSKFRELYANAAYVLLDSRFLVRLANLMKGQSLRASPGSDLTEIVLKQVINPNDVTVVVGGTAQQAQTLRTRFRLPEIHHIDPPMNLVRNPGAIEACVRDIEAVSPFRFCFLALGSPQQEIVANELRRRGIARGLALCIGASINYMTGKERRAPEWMQRQGLEWLFRLLQQPRRMAYRYLVRGPRIFWLLSRIELRPRRPTAVFSNEATLVGQELAAALESKVVTDPGIKLNSADVFKVAGL